MKLYDFSVIFLPQQVYYIWASKYSIYFTLDAYSLTFKAKFILSVTADKENIRVKQKATNLFIVVIGQFSWGSFSTTFVIVS